jgi:hypothetical protein
MAVNTGEHEEVAELPRQFVVVPSGMAGRGDGVVLLICCHNLIKNEHSKFNFWLE